MNDRDQASVLDQQCGSRIATSSSTRAAAVATAPKALRSRPPIARRKFYDPDMQEQCLKDSDNIKDAMLHKKRGKKRSRKGTAKPELDAFKQR